MEGINIAAARESRISITFMLGSEEYSYSCTVSRCDSVGDEMTLRLRDVVEHGRSHREIHGPIKERF